jgi:MFS family permease
MLSYPVRIALIAALGGFLFGFETAVISGAESTIQKMWSLNAFWQGFTVASSLIGTVLGSLIAGIPAKKYGRKKVLMVIAYFCRDRLCIHIRLDIICSFSLHRGSCRWRFFRSGPDVYFGNLTREIARAFGWFLSGEYCYGDIRCLHH